VYFVIPNLPRPILRTRLSRKYLTGYSKEGAASGRLPRAIISGARATFAFVDAADMAELCGVLVRPAASGPGKITL